MGSWRADEPSPHRLHRCTHYTLCQTVRSYKTITPKMSAFGTSTPYAPPGGLVKTVGAAHTRVRHVAGVQATPAATPAPQPQSVGSPPTSKGQAATRFASQALTGFLLRPLRIVLLHPRRWKGVKGDAVVHFTLDALESTQHSAQGNVDRFCHMPLRPRK